MSKKITSPDVGSGHKDGGTRIETGGLQVNEDWPGLFIRGDDCSDLYAGIERLEHAGLPVPKFLRDIKTLIADDVWIHKG